MRAKGPNEIANINKTPVASDKKLVIIGRPECGAVSEWYQDFVIGLPAGVIQ